MMRWLPTICLGGSTACEREGEYEGLLLQVKWLNCMVQFAVGRLERRR